ncbi:MAG TPA: nuclear transport factor 2 family protein [Rhodothermales bacterium]|nr:nuclear transport factor 2 family protein [Rhodothermales bacterium]
MEPDAAYKLVVQFNDCIAAQDIDGLASLLAEEHSFIDTTGNIITGGQDVLRAWAGFFSSFPGYRNLFHHWQSHHGDIVISGASRCSDARLDGPALWRATISPEGIAEWQVYDDTEENRKMLGL